MIPPRINTTSLTQAESGKIIRKFGLGIDHLWILGVLICFIFVISPMPVGPNDFWWHLKIGEIIYSTGFVPSTSIFSWSLGLDYPFTYGAWLAELLFYFLHRIGGLEMIIFARNMLIVSAFGLVGYEAYRRSGSWRIAGVACMLAGAMASNNVEIRPQLWAFIPFISFVIILSGYVDGYFQRVFLLLLPLIIAFWVNVHGSFVLGFILIGIFFIGEALRRLLKIEGMLSWKEIGWIAVSGLLTALAILANPRFLGIIGYVYKMMTDKPSQTLVVEWQSPEPNTYAAVFFFVSILFMMGLLAYSRYKPTPTEALLVAAFLWLAWSGVRYVIWYGMVAMPIMAKIVKEAVKDKPWMAVPPRNLINVIIVFVLAIPALFVQPWFIEKLPMPKSYWKVVLRGVDAGPMVNINTPVAAAEYLKQNPGGQLFNEMGFGSYLIWALPEQGVFVDPRVELYPYEQWIDYIKISNGVRYNELLDKYGANRLLLHKEDQEDLIKSLETDPLWILEYLDEYAQIYTKAP